MSIQPKSILMGVLLLTTACDPKEPSDPKEDSPPSSGTVIRPHKSTDQPSPSLSSSESAAPNGPPQITLSQKYLEGKWANQYVTCSEGVTIDSRGGFIDEFGGGIFVVLGKNRLSISGEGGEFIYDTKVISSDEFHATDIEFGNKINYKRCKKEIKSTQKLSSSDSALIAEWADLNGACRGGPGDDPKTLKACELRDSLDEQLAARNLCYGKVGQAGYQKAWHKCDSSSER